MIKPRDARTLGPTPEDRAIAARLRVVRLARGFSQIDLGEALGVSFQQIQKYERAANRISAGRLLRAARALEVDVMTFFERVDDGNDNPREFRDLLARPGVSKSDMRDLDAYLGLSTDLRRALGVMFTALSHVDAGHAADVKKSLARAFDEPARSGVDATGRS